MAASTMRRRLWLSAAAYLAFTLAASAQNAKSFVYDVVTIKPNNSGPGSVSVSIDDDRYKGENVSLKNLIQYAYDLKTDEQIIGLSGWANSAGFDIQAKMDEDSFAQLKALPDKAKEQQQRLMMQALLADRFHLQIHHETRDLPIYELVIAKSGAKLVESDPTDGKPNGMVWPDGKSHAGHISVRNSELMAQGITTASLTEYLSGRLRRLVVDKTALTGRYDITLHSARDNDANDEAPPLFTALQEQLGLRLESAKGPVDTILIDHIEQPSGN